MNTFIIMISIILLSIVIIALGLFLYNIFVGYHSQCKCYRQSDGGKRGFCGQCVNGTLFGCPGGCTRNCKKIIYSGKPKPQCRV